MLNVKNLTIAPLFCEVNFRVPAGEIVTREIDPFRLDGGGVIR